MQHKDQSKNNNYSALLTKRAGVPAKNAQNNKRKLAEIEVIDLTTSPVEEYREDFQSSAGCLNEQAVLMNNQHTFMSQENNGLPSDGFDNVPEFEDKLFLVNNASSNTLLAPVTHEAIGSPEFNVMEFLNDDFFEDTLVASSSLAVTIKETQNIGETTASISDQHNTANYTNLWDLLFSECDGSANTIERNYQDLSECPKSCSDTVKVNIDVAEKALGVVDVSHARQNNIVPSFELELLIGRFAPQKNIIESFDARKQQKGYPLAFLAKESCYECLLCLDTRNSLESSKKHIHEHWGIKPYACSICNKCYYSILSRNSHTKSCKKKFSVQI